MTFTKRVIGVEWSQSCKRRGFCPNCGARRMAESAALLVDEFAQCAFNVTHVVEGGQVTT